MFFKEVAYPVNRHVEARFSLIILTVLRRKVLVKLFFTIVLPCSFSTRFFTNNLVRQDTPNSIKHDDAIINVKLSKNTRENDHSKTSDATNSSKSFVILIRPEHFFSRDYNSSQIQFFFS